MSVAHVVSLKGFAPLRFAHSPQDIFSQKKQIAASSGQKYPRRRHGIYRMSKVRLPRLKTRNQVGGSSDQLLQHECHHACAVGHVVHANPFVGLMGEVEDAGAVCDAVFQLTNPVDMFLVIGAG